MNDIKCFINSLILASTEGREPMTVEDAAQSLKEWQAEGWEDIPEDCCTYQIPGGLWALFRCEGPLPDSMQKVNTQIWSEWLPTLQGYTLAGNYSLEFYLPPAKEPADTVSYICIPLKKI